jgi:RNA polymerase sporulation-specific sigma factor
MGMLKAVSKFDFSYNVKFSTYAVPVVIGEIKAYIRDDGMIKVSRDMRALAYKALTKREEYINLYGCEPDVSQLAQLLDTDKETLVTALEASSPCEYLYRKIDENSDTYLIDKVSYDMDKGESEIDSLSVRLAVDSLDTGEKEIIKQRYFYGRTQSEVAKDMNVSQVQICRREKKILLKLKGILTC